MADKKITELPAASDVTADDLFPVVDDPGGAPITKKATIQMILNLININVQVYIDRAPAPPDDQSQPALSYPSGGGSLQQWDVATTSWV